MAPPIVINNNLESTKNNPPPTRNKTDEESHQDCYHPISCTRCRKLHKQCDKKLSGCSKCLKVGAECVYNTPQKRGKGSELYALRSKEKLSKSTNEKSGKKMVNSNSFDNNRSSMRSNSEKSSIPNLKQQPSCPLSPNQVIEIYFTFMCGIHPLIERAKFVHFVNYFLPLIEKKTEVEFQPDEWIKTKAEMKCIYAFYLGVLTLSCQLIGELEYVDFILGKIDMEIAALSVDYLNEFYWGASCHLMFMAWIAEGNQLKANYYHSLINFYLENENNLREDRFYQSLLHYKTLVSARFVKELNNMENLLDNFYQLFFYSVNKKLDEFLLPGTWDYMKSTKVTPQNFVLFKQVSHFIFKSLMKYKSESMKALHDCHCDNYFKQQRLFITILSEGYSFLFLKQIPEVSYNMMEESALRITLLTENELFPYCMFAVISAVTETCAFHLNVCKMVERGLRPRMANIVTSSGQTVTFDNFSILEKDLRAITILSKRYRRVNKLYKDLIDEMTQVLNRNSLHHHNISPMGSFLVTSPSTSNIDIPLQNDEILSSIIKQLTQQEENNITTPTLSEASNESLTPWDEIFEEATPSSFQ